MDNVSCVDRSKLPSDCTAIDQVISVVLHDWSVDMWLSVVASQNNWGPLDNV